MNDLSKSDVEALYREGASAVTTITSSFSTDDWAAPACGEWDAADTVRHLVGVVDWYHEWLGRALNGDADPPFPEREFEARNATRVAELHGLDGPQAVMRFAERAGDYLDRASQEWNRPYGFPAGTVTVGLHAGIAATEWHLHAWDLTTGSTERHHPDAPADLFMAAGAAMAVATGGLRGGLLRAAVPLAARRSPWKTLLKQSGRS